MSVTPEPSDHLRIVAVIQARMGSTRLPGKVLKPIAGKPLLWHVVHRLQRSSLIERIVVATSDNPRDDAIVEWARENDVAVVRGPEDNVLARFARAAELLDADVIVRVNSDAPFLDAGFIDHLIGALLEQDGDYVLLEEGAETAHQGVDPFTRRALDKLMMDAANDPAAREHVTGYFKLHPDFVRIARAPAYPAFDKPGARLTIDTPDDLAFVETVHERLAAKAGEASLSDLLLLLEREPELRAMNAHVRQKPIFSHIGGLALIRCDGGGGYGYGHVKRMVALAKALRDREDIGAMFAVNGTVDALEPIKNAGFEACLVDQAEDAAFLSKLIAVRRPELLICDMREGPSQRELEALARDVSITAVVDDGSARRLAADVAYYPPVPQAAVLDWTGSDCVARIGWEWALLGLTKTRTNVRPRAPRPSLLITMGGSDPFGLTLRTARALANLDPIFRARFVIGPGMENTAQTAKRIASLAPHFETIENADDLTTEFAASDLALTAFGVTAYELAAYGVPALYLCLNEDHALSASAFERAGMGVSLGVHDKIEDFDIASAAWALIGDNARRRDMHAAGLMTIDGGGAARIAADLSASLKQRCSTTPSRIAS
ncbi:MAG: NTP transferase domain-containing protein [Proteobacteria bacterium]|nr:NTP transferase domain-containing protein [Pseudomonadota bacterium]